MNKANYPTTTIPSPVARHAASRRSMPVGLAAAPAVPAPALTNALKGTNPIYVANCAAVCSTDCYR